MATERASIAILQECIELQRKKAADYQNPNSSVVQAMHYRRGIDTIFDMMSQKMLRMQSLLESGTAPKNESLRDSALDLINYASFFASFLDGTMEGQNPARDAFNRPIPKSS